MASLISHNSRAPKIDTTVFPNMDKTRLLYWTSEQVDDSSAWYADFGSGTVEHYFGDYDFLKERFNVLLVRTRTGCKELPGSTTVLKSAELAREIDIPNAMPAVRGETICPVLSSSVDPLKSDGGKAAPAVAPKYPTRYNSP